MICRVNMGASLSPLQDAVLLSRFMLCNSLHRVL